MDIINNSWVFIHVPKTGGTTVSSIFNESGSFDTLHLGMHAGRSKGIITFMGISANVMKYDNVVTIARHPVNRLVSLYVQMISQFDKNLRCPRCGVIQCDKHNIKDVLDYFQSIPNPTANEFMRLLKFKDELPANLKILQFDTLQRDVTNFCKNEFNVTITDFPHLNSKTGHYTDMYNGYINDDEIRNLILQKTEEECEYFGYK